MRKLTKGQKRDLAAIAAKKDEDIDLSDFPPILNWSGAEIGKFYRPAKKPGVGCQQETALTAVRTVRKKLGVRKK